MEVLHKGLLVLIGSYFQTNRDILSFINTCSRFRSILSTVQFFVVHHRRGALAPEQEDRQLMSRMQYLEACMEELRGIDDWGRRLRWRMAFVHQMDDVDHLMGQWRHMCLFGDAVADGDHERFWLLDIPRMNVVAFNRRPHLTEELCTILSLYSATHPQYDYRFHHIVALSHLLQYLRCDEAWIAFCRMLRHLNPFLEMLVNNHMPLLEPCVDGSTFCVTYCVLWAPSFFALVVSPLDCHRIMDFVAFHGPSSLIYVSIALASHFVSTCASCIEEGRDGLHDVMAVTCLGSPVVTSVLASARNLMSDHALQASWIQYLTVAAPNNMPLLAMLNETKLRW